MSFQSGFDEQGCPSLGGCCILSIPACLLSANFLAPKTDNAVLKVKFSLCGQTHIFLTSIVVTTFSSLGVIIYNLEPEILLKAHTDQFQVCDFF